VNINVQKSAIEVHTSSTTTSSLLSQTFKLSFFELELGNDVDSNFADIL
jgi:hypothetical protein